jgi:ABC-type cobalamin/Fe3+-siderophores transport system ATPase subunit
MCETCIAAAQGGASCGVVGRTGSGKSSLMLTLFRLIDVTAGRILLGGVDTASVGLDALRSHLAIIPQARGVAVRTDCLIAGKSAASTSNGRPGVAPSVVHTSLHAFLS